MNLNKYIDHTNLKPDAKQAAIDKLCFEAMEYHFKTVCVNPYWVAYCHKFLRDSAVGVCTVIGFPLGANTTATKVFEAKEAVANGADEIDMVMNIGALKDQNYTVVLDDIRQVKTGINNRVLKVIIETCLLTTEEIIKACEICLQAKANYVKTSTGFSTGGATVETVKLMKSVVKDQILIKASGGIKDKQFMVALIEAGADRIGTSAGVALIK